MNKAAEEINAATCADELFEISKKYRQMFGVWSKKYDDIVGLCLNRFKQIYHISYHKYRKSK